MTAEKLLEHQGAILLAQSDGCAVWQFRNETGDGTMTTYEIFSGVMLAFNDFHMERYECDFVADRRMLAIDHCREGRMDYAASDNLVAYTAAGDMKLDFCASSTRARSTFRPATRHGLTVAFDRNIVKESLPCEVRDFPATPEKIDRALAARQYAACRPRGRADGAHLRRDVPRAGKDTHPVLQGQNFRAVCFALMP